MTVCKVYALDRSASGLGVLGVGGGGGAAGIIGSGLIGIGSSTDYASVTTCYPPASTGLGHTTHPQPPMLLDPAMTPTSAPTTASTPPTGPNNPVAMSQLGTVYATKRRRRNGKRSVHQPIFISYFYFFDSYTLTVWFAIQTAR